MQSPGVSGAAVQPARATMKCKFCKWRSWDQKCRSLYVPDPKRPHAVMANEWYGRMVPMEWGGCTHWKQQNG